MTKALHHVNLVYSQCGYLFTTQKENLTQARRMVCFFPVRTVAVRSSEALHVSIYDNILEQKNPILSSSGGSEFIVLANLAYRRHLLKGL